MSVPPLTRVSLLVRLRNPADTEAWKEFTRLYASVIFGFARKRGLQDADAADLMQEVLRSVSGAVGRLEYDPKKGTFRGWLYSIARNKVYNFLEARRRQPRGTGDSNANHRFDEVPDRANESDQWELEYQRTTFRWAAERVKREFQENTWKAFWLTAVDGVNPTEAGQRLGMSPGAVYVAKSRVIARLRQEIETLADES